jgi:hypothetical protein
MMGHVEVLVNGGIGMTTITPPVVDDVGDVVAIVVVMLPGNVVVVVKTGGLAVGPVTVTGSNTH